MIQEEVSNRLKKMLEDVAKSSLSATNNISRLLLVKLIESIQKEKDKAILNKEGEVALKKMLAAVEKGETLKNIIVPDEEIENLKPLLKETGTLFAVTDISKDDSKMILFLDRDTEKVEKALTLLKADRKLINEINPDLFISHTKGKELAVTSMSEADLELFRHHAKASGLVFATAITNHKAQVFYELKDKDKAKDVLTKTAWDLTGEQGPLVRQHIEYSLYGRQEINIAIEQAEKEFYIVSSNAPKNYVKITPQDFSYYKNNQMVMGMERSDSNFIDNAHTKVESLSEPVLLTKEEFEISSQERLKDIIAEKTNIYPVGYTAFDQLMNKYKERRATEIAEMKMSLDNGNQPEHESSYDNPDVSFSEFFANEIINDDNDKEHAKEALKYEQAFDTQEITVKGRNKGLDEVLRNIEKMRKTQDVSKEKGKDKIRDNDDLSK